MSKYTRYLLIGITAAFLLLTLVKSFYLAKKYGGCDLRCRVVGARVMKIGHSPYYYKWNPSEGEFYLNPNDVAMINVNGNVVTPAALDIIYPLCLLPYSQVRILWTILQILAAAGIIILLFRSRNISTTFLQASPIILGFICSDLWLYNIERGQMYIFYAFLFALMYCCYISHWKYNQFMSGFIGGLFILFRPFAAVMGLAFLLHGKKQWIFGAITGCVIGILIFVLPQRKAWQEYFSAMQEYVKQGIGSPLLVSDRTEPIKPTVIEGMNNLRDVRSFPVRGLRNFYTLLKDMGITITPNQSLLAFAILLIFLSWFFFRLRSKITDPEPVFLFAFLLFILSELFVPARRGGYNVIMWMVPVSLIYLRARSNYPILIIIITGFLFLHSYPFYFPAQGELAELTFLLLTSLVIFFPATLKKIPDGISRT